MEGLSRCCLDRVAAVRDFVRVLREWERERRPGFPTFPTHLGVKVMVGQRVTVMEFRWAPDGRCTWHYGKPRQKRFHIVWRRIGTHAIYENP